jgi:hypothetical protein
LEARLAPSILIPVTTHRDLVFDPSRELLYITTSSGTIERYDVVNQKLLSDFSVGTSLYGADITPDDNFLYVAENQTTATQGTFHKVNLANGTVQDLTYTLAANENGGWDVAIGPNNIGLITTQSGGWVPLRQLDLTTDTMSIRTDVPSTGFGGTITGNSPILRSTDRSLFFVPAGIKFFTYNSSSNTFPSQAPSYASNQMSAVNRNGTLIAKGIGSAVSIINANFQAVQNLLNVDGGVAFDPIQDILYAATSATNQIIAYDTNTWAEKYRLDIGETISSWRFAFNNGAMTVSNDGKFLFLATTQGVRMFPLPVSTGVASSLTISGYSTFIAANVPGSFTITARDPAGNIAAGYTGTVRFTSSDGAAGLPGNYTFTAADMGVHTFTATLKSAGTQSITVADPGNNLSASQTNIIVHANPVSLIPVTNHQDLIFDANEKRLVHHHNGWDG